jgi:hypothetical protein
MIADGFVTSEHFFHHHPFLTEIDRMTDKQIPQDVSLLDDLIEISRSRLPDLSRFAQGLFRKSQKPEEQVLEDFDLIGSVLSACRSNTADPWVRQSATDPEVMARSWGAFANRSAALQLQRCPASVRATFLRGLDELENLPSSMAKATSASDFACLVHVLGIEGQNEAFRRTVQIILSTPNTGNLMCNVASSLVHLARCWVPSCASYLLNNSPNHIYDALAEAIGKAVGKDDRTIEIWNNKGKL